MPKPSTDPRQVLTDTMLNELIKYVGGWIATLGNAGNPKNKRVRPSDRISAAKTGIDLVVKLMGKSTNYDGERRLGELEALAEQADAFREEAGREDAEEEPDEAGE